MLPHRDRIVALARESSAPPMLGPWPWFPIGHTHHCRALVVALLGRFPLFLTRFGAAASTVSTVLLCNSHAFACWKTHSLCNYLRPSLPAAFLTRFGAEPLRGGGEGRGRLAVRWEVVGERLERRDLERGAVEGAQSRNQHGGSRCATQSVRGGTSVARWPGTARDVITTGPLAQRRRCCKEGQ
jgi:hypothetical protein